MPGQQIQTFLEMTEHFRHFMKCLNDTNKQKDKQKLMKSKHL